MTIRDEDKATRIMSIRWSEREWRKAQELYQSASSETRTFSQFVRAMVLTGTVRPVTVFTDPARVTGAVGKVGRNVDDLLRLARSYGIEPGEISDLAIQMRQLNSLLQEWWDEYNEARHGRP